MHKVSNRPETHSFQKVQLGFAARIREPEHHPLPEGVDARHMAVYEELIYNNIESLLSSAFPVMHRIHTDDEWHALVRRFIADHRAQTPYFSALAGEFLQYLNKLPTAKHRFPFIPELAHYEWLELALSIAEMPELPGHDADGDLLHGMPLLSPLVQMHSYSYPVHRISPGFLPDRKEQQPSHLLVYRDREDEVGFIELNPITALLIEHLQAETKQTGRQMLHGIAESIHHPNPETVIRGGLEILHDLRQRCVVLGTYVQEEN